MLHVLYEYRRRGFISTPSEADDGALSSMN